MIINPMDDPVATYLDIQHKIDHAEEGEVYSGPEMARDIARLLLAARSMIQQNQRLAAQVASANRLVEEQTIEIFTKDMEIHELQQKGSNDPPL